MARRSSTTRRSDLKQLLTLMETTTASQTGTASNSTYSLTTTTRTSHLTIRGGYLYVHDADALYEEWSRPGIGGETLPVCSTPYKLREGAHVDPDGNLIRFGSPMEE